MSMVYTILWYIRNIWAYVVQMLPCVAVACFVWMLYRPYRVRSLNIQGLCSSVQRETTLLGFVVFCTGLGALTLFPHDFWSGVISVMLNNDKWFSLTEYYPDWAEVSARIQTIPNNLKPFHEIRRVLWGGPWLWFVLWGNIGMFLPIGFCTALLWRNARWYRSVAAGFLTSAMIEVVQLFIGRVSDIDDIILNTTGALLGYWLYLLFHGAVPDITQRFCCQRKEGMDSDG